jgi:hypothetical protein
MAPSIKIKNVDLEIKEFNLPIEMNLISDFTEDKDFEIIRFEKCRFTYS